MVRLEQLYPFPADAFAGEVNKYPNAKEVVWCQEEPRNQGVWYWLASRHHLDSALGDQRTSSCWCRVRLRLRRPSATTPSTTRNKRRLSKMRSAKSKPDAAVRAELNKGRETC
jgi:2-oxoglutarate dehydrogenase E1 component